MMMAVDAVEHLDSHAKKIRGFPFVDAGLHQSRRGRMSQRRARFDGTQANHDTETERNIAEL
jgi:hypothetical protein